MAVASLLSRLGVKTDWLCGCEQHSLYCDAEGGDAGLDAVDGTMAPGCDLLVTPGLAAAMAEAALEVPWAARSLGVRKYQAADIGDLTGPPRREGQVWHVVEGETLEQVHLAIHDNGFRVISSGEFADSKPLGRGNAFRAWSPFAVVESCQVKTAESLHDLWGVFKLTFLVETEGSYYFATSGKQALKNREHWVAEIHGAICRLRASLFPPHEIVVRPLPGRIHTETRIMAGYLLLLEADSTVALLYWELHAYLAHESQLVAYEDERCLQQVLSMSLTPQTRLSSRTTGECTCFTIDRLCLCARSIEEKGIWLRAVSNVKVKLLYDAPDPSASELQVIRDAVLERVVELSPRSRAGRSDKLEGEDPEAWPAAWEESSGPPMLPLCPRPPVPAALPSAEGGSEPGELGEDASSVGEPSSIQGQPTPTVLGDELGAAVQPAFQEGSDLSSPPPPPPPRHMLRL